MMFALLQVGQLERYNARQDKILENEVAEKALTEMSADHPEARRLFCGGRGVLENEDQGTTKQIDEVIVADNCCMVLVVSACKAHMDT